MSAEALVPASEAQALVDRSRPRYIAVRQWKLDQARELRAKLGA